MRPTEGGRHRAAAATGAVLAAALWLSAGPLPAAPADSAAGLLARAVHSADRVAYSGRKVTVLGRGGATEATITQEYHSKRGQVRLETVLPRRARGRVVIDDGRDRWQYEPGRRLLLRSPSTAEPPLSDLGHLQQNYALARAARPERVADRWVDVVTLAPRVPGKPSRKLWLDRETGLVLRVEKFHPDGSPLSASQFTEIRIGQRQPDRLFQPPQGAGIRVQRAASEEVSLSRADLGGRFRVAAPDVLPAGYRFTGGRLVTHQGITLAHLRYQDGLSLVSLYLASPGHLPEAAEPAPRSDTGPRRPGNASTTHHNVYTWHTGTADCALVGDLSPALLQELARGTGLAAQSPRRTLGRRSRTVLAAALALLAFSGLLSWYRRVNGGTARRAGHGSLFSAR
jgi:outer membrane lipoprotein-sorting protein